MILYEINSATLKWYKLHFLPYFVVGTSLEKERHCYCTYDLYIANVGQLCCDGINICQRWNCSS
jgi:hypothetical protein